MITNRLMETAPALLERWMREYYFTTDIDIGSSGVESFSMAELRKLLRITPDELDRIVFNDSHTIGNPELRAALARRFGGGDPGRVMATQGSSEAIFLTMNAMLRTGDEVVVMDPSYQQLFAMAESLGCRLKHWPLRDERAFAPDIEELEGLISSHTRMIVVNFPHNPTGVTISREDQARLIEMAARVGAYLIWDGAFAELTYDEPPLPDPSLYYERAISFGTLSKAYGLPGLRVGWCFASPDILSRFAHLRDYTILHLSPLVEFIAQRAIENAEMLLDIRLQQARANRRILADWVEEQDEAVSWVSPRGGVCAFLRLNEVTDVEALCRHLADVYNTLLVPGICFNRPRHVRLGFGCSTPRLEAGLSNLSILLKARSRAAH